MAKNKVTVTYNGKVIGTRQTDRTYTHALVLTDFDPSVLRARAEREWPAYGITSAKNMHSHAVEAKEPTYRYASVVSAEERARMAAVAAMPLEDYVAQCRVAHFERYEKLIAHRAAQGSVVLSYHMSRDLAFKAQAQANKTHGEYLVLVEPTDQYRATYA